MIATVVRIGGSLIGAKELDALCQKLSRLGRHTPMLVVPGGGPFADAVRREDRRHKLGDAVAHWMAILGMDQYGWLLSDRIPDSERLTDLWQAAEVAAQGCIPVILPFALLYALDPLPHSWDVTSDTISAWIAVRLGAKRLILLKDTDGLYDTDPNDASARLQDRVSVEQLGQTGGVDPHLSRVVKDADLDVWVLNGRRPERLVELLESGSTRGSHCPPRGL